MIIDGGAWAEYGGLMVALEQSIRVECGIEKSESKLSIRAFWNTLMVYL